MASSEWIVGILIGWAANVVALLVVDSLFESVSIGRWGSIILAGAVLGIANGILKPILALLTLPLIIITLGLAYFFLNVLMLLITEWITPDFSIDGFWTYIGATIVIWLVNWILYAALGALFGNRPARVVA
ncbi:MAG TPA: phage holin family protein [Gaiellaceae bacterium]|nr:phage holin family protein [Gaiellaceae bacterium]